MGESKTRLLLEKKLFFTLIRRSKVGIVVLKIRIKFDIKIIIKINKLTSNKCLDGNRVKRKMINIKRRDKKRKLKLG